MLDHVLARKVELAGTTTIVDVSIAHEAANWECHRRLCHRMLCMKFDNLTVDEKIALSAEIGKAARERSRCLKALGLDAPPESDSIWALPALPEPESAEDGAEPAEPAEVDQNHVPDRPDAPETILDGPTAHQNDEDPENSLEARRARRLAHSAQPNGRPELIDVPSQEPAP
jgi:hypothetical protein